jgi:hypothetical protein
MKLLGPTMCSSPDIWPQKSQNRLFSWLQKNLSEPVFHEEISNNKSIIEVADDQNLNVGQSIQPV